MKQGMRAKKLEAIPVYRRIEQDIRIKIRDGIWPDDMLVPSRMKLVKEYGVGLPTIEHAIDLLIADGLLRAEVRRGTFVEKDAQKRLASLEMEASLSQQKAFFALVAEEKPPLLNIPEKPFVPLLGIIAADFPAILYDEQQEFSWSTRVLRSIERTFSHAGGRVFFLERFPNADEKLPPLEESILRLLLNGIDALAVINVYDAQRVSNEIRKVLDVDQVPVILHSWHPIKGSLPCITYDSVQGGYQATKHLLDMGYYPLVFLDCWDIWWLQERLQGVQAACQDAGLPPEALRIQTCSTLARTVPQAGPASELEVGMMAGQKLFHELFIQQNGLLAQKGHYPGIIAPNDAIAHGFLQAALEAGQQPGSDFGLIGFDDLNASREAGLTSLCPPLEELGAEAARLLLQRLQGKALPLYTQVHSHLIRRASTNRQPKEAHLHALADPVKQGQHQLRAGTIVQDVNRRKSTTPYQK